MQRYHEHLYGTFYYHLANPILLLLVFFSVPCVSFYALCFLLFVVFSSLPCDSFSSLCFLLFLVFLSLPCAYFSSLCFLLIPCDYFSSLCSLLIPCVSWLSSWFLVFPSLSRLSLSVLVFLCPVLPRIYLSCSHTLPVKTNIDGPLSGPVLPNNFKPRGCALCSVCKDQYWRYCRQW